METRIHSKALNRIVKYDGKTATVKDLNQFGARGYVTYSQEELKILNGTLGEITPKVHMVKSIFDGVIVREATE